MQRLYSGDMSQLPASLRRPARPGDLRGRRGALRRFLAAPVIGVLTAAALMLTPALANADSPTTLTVVGTSDASDSGLVPNVIQPKFHAAFPQFSFKYVGSATGTAIQNAETGNGGPSVLIVHAASLENQFVAGGFSYNNQYGNAIFTNDFVLAGPTTDSAHANVGSNAPNNIAQAFADVAAAGVAGTATFESRGGATTASGTTVEEHQLWALVNSSGLTPAGVVLCTVSAADGGGMSPIDPAVQTTSGQACPDSGTVLADAPSWYVVNNVNQSASVIAANACTFAGRPANSCYALTDRGTFDYLSSQTSTSASGLIPNLAIVTRNNSASAPGGQNELINYFHAYIINPSVSVETVNLAAAQDFVNFLTSPGLQSQLSSYLSTTTDPAGPPFVADASPNLTASASSVSVAAGKAVTVTGTVTNVEPGFPAIAGKPVTVDELEGILPVPVGTALTAANGSYSVTFTPPSSGSYEVTTGQISQIEEPSLSPVYGDLLSPASTSPFTITVGATATIAQATTSTGSVQVSGSVGPAAPDGNARVILLARTQTSKGAFSEVGAESLKADQSLFAVNGALPGGAWTIEVEYQDQGLLTAATSATRNVTVPASSTNVGFKKLTVKNGALTLSGTLGQAPTTSGATVKLFALSLGKVTVSQTKQTTRLVAEKASAPTFRQVAKVTVRSGKTTYTIKHKFRRGVRYVLQLEYVHKGQISTYSKYKYLDVH
jgi:tungstate transport system substrate-binding protein